MHLLLLSPLSPKQLFCSIAPQTLFLLISDFGETIDTRINELVKLVIAWTRKFGDDGPFVSRLEPVPGVRGDRVLVSRMQFDLVKDRIVRFGAFRYVGLSGLVSVNF